MRAVVQRVLRASVSVHGELVGQIGPGLLVLVGVTHGDQEQQAVALAGKLHRLRVLRGELALCDVPDPAALIVSQFTLYGDVRKGRRPSWQAAAPGEVAEPLVAAVAEELRRAGVTVGTGRFGADMQVESVNDGPVTLVLEF